MGIPEAHGSFSARLLYPHEVEIELPRIKDLMLETKDDWGFYDTLDSMVDVARQGFVLSINNGEAYAVGKAMGWPSGNISIVVVWANGPKIDDHAVTILKSLLATAKVTGAQRVEMLSCAKGDRLLRNEGMLHLHRTLYKDVNNAVGVAESNTD